MSDSVLFPGPLPEPVTVEDLSDRLMLLCGYMLGALVSKSDRSSLEFERQDKLAAAALRWCVPYVQDLLALAAAHPEEFRALRKGGTT